MSDKLSEPVWMLSKPRSLASAAARRFRRRRGASLKEAECKEAEWKIGCGYRGSWAEQSVVARLARKRTAKATRITTTPPTVNRSQRSELLPANNSCFAAMDLVLMPHSKEFDGDFSDPGHRQVPDRILPLWRGHRDQNVPTMTSLLSFVNQEVNR